MRPRQAQALAARKAARRRRHRTFAPFYVALTVALIALAGFVIAAVAALFRSDWGPALAWAVVACVASGVFGLILVLLHVWCAERRGR